jgi:hypothetical protein
MEHVIYTCRFLIHILGFLKRPNCLTGHYVLIHKVPKQRILWYRRHIDIRMDASEIFSSPLLIYDDKCSSCTKFANIAKALSGGHIRIAGHYSDEAIRSKDLIFPKTFDPTGMFWLINKNGAYGARSGLI